MSRGSPFTLRPAALTDLRGILAQTGRQFGTVQRGRYAALVRAACSMAAEAPFRVGSTDRSDLLPGLRSFPVWLAARRRGASPHRLFYRAGAPGVRILRILHEGMDPALHLAEDAQS